MRIRYCQFDCARGAKVLYRKGVALYVQGGSFRFIPVVVLTVAKMRPQKANELMGAFAFCHFGVANPLPDCFS
jgi:hypothetical protein